MPRGGIYAYSRRRGRENVLKRQLIHVGGFNLSLIFRQTLGAGTPRELRNRQQRPVFIIFVFTMTPWTGADRRTVRFLTRGSASRRFPPHLISGGNQPFTPPDVRTR